MTAPAPAFRRDDLGDGGWHRPIAATPLLRGGLALVAIAGILIANFRERLIAVVIGQGGYEGDPVDLLIDNGLLPAGLGVSILVIAIVVVLFYVSWRMYTFRVTDELVEVRSGVLFRSNRRARLDRIQGVGIERTLFARIFGAARLELQVAGDDANVRIEYLRGRDADALRGEILRRASGVRAAERAAAEGPADGAPAAGAAEGPNFGGTLPGLVQTRMGEFLAPERDPALAPPESVVEMHPGRLIGSAILSGRTFWFLVIIALIISGAIGADNPLLIVTVVPILLALGSVTIRHIAKFLRYSVAATPDGVRIGFGLLSMSSETVPPGRIHSISVSQPLIWRPVDWWTIRINRASRSRSNSQQQQNSTVLPVGSRADALKVLRVLLPELADDDLQPLLESGFSRDRGTGRYSTSPPRARVIRWFSWRRNGFALVNPVALLRRGAIWRELVIVPFARIQSVSIHQGWLGRRMRLAGVHLHTVQGPISAQLGALDEADAGRFFRDLESDAVRAAAADHSAHWGRPVAGSTA
ncbi:MAG: PH domain-containing protein [Micrococcales bacterium]|nr:PH domain-containing protein [Micrococcales bacterium]